MVYDLNEPDVFLVREKHAFEKSSSFVNAVENLINSNDLLKQDFAEMNVVIAVDRYTFVPNGLFSTNLANDYFKFNHGDLADGEGVFFTLFDEAALYVVFSYDKLFVDLIENMLPNAQIVPDVSWRLSKVYDKGKKTVNGVYAEISDNILNVIVFKSAKFMMANTYKFVSIEDAEYLLLKAYNVFEFDNETVPLFINSSVELPHVKHFVKNITVENENN